MFSRARAFLFIVLVFLVFLSLLLYGSPRTFVFWCRQRVFAEYTINTEGLEPRRHIEKAEYDIAYEVRLNGGEDYTIKYAHLVRQLDGKSFVYETGKENGSGTSAKVLRFFEKHPLSVESREGTIITSETVSAPIIADTEGGMEKFISVVVLSLPHRMPQRIERRSVNAKLSLPLGELFFSVSYRRGGGMGGGSRWEVVLDKVHFTVKEPYSEVVTASVKEAFLGGWALYDKDGILLANRLQYRITLVVTQTSLVPNLEVESTVSSQLIVERER